MATGHPGKPQLQRNHGKMVFPLARPPLEGWWHCQTWVLKSWVPFPLLRKYNKSSPILHQKWSVNWISLLIPSGMMVCNCPVAACLTAALLYLTRCDYGNWLYSESCCDLLWRGQLKKNSLRGILLDANSTRTALQCSLSSLISISSIPLYSSLCSTVMNWLEMFFALKWTGQKKLSTNTRLTVLHWKL